MARQRRTMTCGRLAPVRGPLVGVCCLAASPVCERARLAVPTTVPAVVGGPPQELRITGYYRAVGFRQGSRSRVIARRYSLRAFITLSLHPVLRLWGHATGGVARDIVPPPVTPTQYVPSGHPSSRLIRVTFAAKPTHFGIYVLLVRSPCHRTVPPCRILTVYCA